MEWDFKNVFDGQVVKKLSKELKIEVFMIVEVNVSNLELYALWR